MNMTKEKKGEKSLQTVTLTTRNWEYGEGPGHILSKGMCLWNSQSYIVSVIEKTNFHYWKNPILFYFIL